MLETLSILGLGTLLYIFLKDDKKDVPPPNVTPVKQVTITNIPDPVSSQNTPDFHTGINETRSPQYTPVENLVRGDEKLYGMRGDPQKPFDIYYKDEKGNTYSLGKNFLSPKDPYSLFVFSGPIDLVEANKVGDTSKIEKANDASKATLVKMYMSYLEEIGA